MNCFDLCIKHGNVVSPAGVQKLDVGVANGKIVSLEKDLSGKSTETIDAANRLIFPGIIDAHTHFGIPILNTQSADDFASGSMAAAFGGVTTIIDFTVQQPGQSLLESFDSRLNQARGKSHVDFGFHVNITSQPEKWLQEISQLIRLGVRSFKLFFTYENMMVNERQFRLVMEKVAGQDGLVMLHAEDHHIVRTGIKQYVSAGETTPIYHARSRPPQAEALAIKRASRIARELGAPLYIVHLSSKAGLTEAKRARDAGAKLFLETCPQYLLLTEEAYLQPNGHYYITTPPLREKEDCKALWRALADDEIDVVATDHCPFTQSQKNCGNGEFHKTPNGLPGVETLFPLLFTYGVGRGRISTEKLVRLLAQNPARIFSLSSRKGKIAVGADADLIIWNPAVEDKISIRQLHGNADWNPYEGKKIAGRLEHTILRGQFLVRDGRFVGEAVKGRYAAGDRTDSLR